MSDLARSLRHPQRRSVQSQAKATNSRSTRTVDGSETAPAISRECSDEASVVQRMPSPASTRSGIVTNSISSGESATGNSSIPDEPELSSVPLHEQGGWSIDDEFELNLISRRNKRVLLSRLQEVSPRGNLCSINLSRRGLTEADAHYLEHALLTNPNLSTLKLSYNELGDEGCTIVAKGVLQNGVHHANLSLLDLGFNDIGDEGCEAISVHVLAGNNKMHTLLLSGNRIGEKGVMSIAGAILHGTGLCNLSMSANKINSTAIKTLSGAIAETDAKVSADRSSSALDRGGIKLLDLGNCTLSGEGFISLPGMLLTSKLITTLSLTNCGLADSELSLVAQALSQNKNIPIRDLIFSFNRITCSGVEDLMNAVWGSTTLKQIKLDNNRLQDRGAQLCAVVLTSVPLEILDISCNPISSAGIKALMKNISENTSLVSLGICGINVDQNAAKAVSYALAYNGSLQRIYMDKCEAGYTAQRHIVAGIVSNRTSSLRLFTGFPIGAIASTLGIPRLPDDWSNGQVLGFLGMMWKQWLLKSGRGTIVHDIRGPAPPAAVATASKLAFASLGAHTEGLFITDDSEKANSERLPVDPASLSFMERTKSGNIQVPSFAVPIGEELSEWAEVGSKPASAEKAVPASHAASAHGLLNNPGKRNKYLHWLREHFVALTDIGRLPFNDADLWQLHQHYFSPPSQFTAHDDESIHTPPGDPPTPVNQAPPSTPKLQPTSAFGRSISFQSLGSALAASAAGGHKRRFMLADEPPPKRVKAPKQRIAYYPRLMFKIQSLSSYPTDEALSLLRQLKYTENILFKGLDPYSEPSNWNQDPQRPLHSDIEMILLDLL